MKGAADMLLLSSSRSHTRFVKCVVCTVLATSARRTIAFDAAAASQKSSFHDATIRRPAMSFWFVASRAIPSLYTFVWLPEYHWLVMFE